MSEGAISDNCNRVTRCLPRLCFDRGVMREELKYRVGKRERFAATVGRFGIKKYKHHVSKTILLLDIRDESGAQVTDHMWQRIGKQIEELNPQIGERLSFVASVGSYQKGYRGNRDDEYCSPIETDYCFKFAAKFKRVDPVGTRVLPLFTCSTALGMDKDEENRTIPET